MEEEYGAVRSFDGFEGPASSVLIESLEGGNPLPHGDAGLHVVIDGVGPVENFLRG
jgi:hypothetical protein